MCFAQDVADKKGRPKAASHRGLLTLLILLQDATVGSFPVGRRRRALGRARHGDVQGEEAADDEE